MCSGTTRPGRPAERLSFADDPSPDPVRPVFAARQSQCYLPGKPHFERLVQHWVDHHAHHVADRTAATAAADDLARRWCRRQPGCEFVSAAYTPDRTDFQGVMHLRVRAGTGVDHFEKVLRGRVPALAGHDRLDPADDDRPMAADARVAGLVPHYADPLQRVVAADPEVVKFCQFYQGRQDAALAAAGDEYRRRKVEGDFRPYVQAEVLGLDGVQYDSGTIEVTFRADGVEYRETLTAVPATAQLLAEPPTARRAVTGQT